MNRIAKTAAATSAARWSREQIRAARKAALAPLLQARGMELRELEAGNFTLPQAHRGLLLKDNYWRCPERQLAGNTIDFFTQILGLTSHRGGGARDKWGLVKGREPC